MSAYDVSIYLGAPSRQSGRRDYEAHVRTDDGAAFLGQLIGSEVDAGQRVQLGDRDIAEIVVERLRGYGVAVTMSDGESA